MRNIKKGFVAPLLLIIITLLLIGSAIYVYQNNIKVETDSPMASTTTQPTSIGQTSNQTQALPEKTAEPATQTQLAIDLSKVTPQFITRGSVLSSDLEKIRQDVKSILLPGEQNDSQVGIALNAVGKRYVVATVLRPTDAGSNPRIIDSVTLKSSNYIPGLFQFTVGKTAVYVSATDICTYMLDQSSCVPLQGAKLSGGEMYGDNEQAAGYFVPQDLTHTNTSMTIAVLAWTNPYTNQAKLQKVRDITLTLPTSNAGSTNTTSAFSFSPLLGKAPLSVTTASFDVCQFNTIDWGDGSTAWSSGDAQRTCEFKNPLYDKANHTYAAPGTYTATLRNPSGNTLGTVTVTVSNS